MPPERIITSAAHSHQREITAQLDQRPLAAVLLQPHNRDTATGIFLFLACIRAKYPDATVVLSPSDVFLYPQGRLLDIVRES